MMAVDGFYEVTAAQVPQVVTDYSVTTKTMIQPCSLLTH